MVDSKLDELVTATEASSRLGVSVMTVIQWSKRGYMDENNERQYVKPGPVKSPQGKPMYWFRDCAIAWRATARRAGRYLPTAAA